jgi:DNA-binding response OmpR family regulator
MSAAQAPKILVVDDDPAIADCVCNLLRESGYSVDIGNDSQRALKTVAENPARYGILISDNSMPHLSGGQLTEGARKAGYQGKILIYSGSISPDEETDFKAIGADAVLRKPFDFKLLIPTIEDLCGHGDSDSGHGPNLATPVPGAVR